MNELVSEWRHELWGNVRGSSETYKVIELDRRTHCLELWQPRELTQFL